MKNLRRVGLKLIALSALAAQFSCGGGGESTPPPVATTLTANSATTLTATAGTAVATAPSVLVRDQNGNAMAGVPVAFNVGTGGGSVTGAAAITNSSGVATVGGWTLGTSVGANTLIASTGSLTPVTFTATAAAGAAASITKTAGDAQTAPAGSAVPIPPSVTIKDANGNPVAGAAVSFAVTAGGGSVTGGSQTTNSSGVATVSSWTLGPSAGTNSLSATSGSLTAAVFTATGTVGAAASVTKTAGDNQTAEDGTTLPIAPAVTVRDAAGNPVSGITVIFAVGTGGGSLTGGTQVTNASGVATVGSWTLGTVGPQTLTATAGTLPPVTFNATATRRAACSVATPHPFGGTSNGTLATTDCRLSGGEYVDFWTTTVSPAGAYVFTQVATAPTGTTPIDAYLLLYGPDGWIVGFNDDADPASNPTLSTDSRLKVLLPSANYVPATTSFDVGEVGNYALTSAPTAASISNCEQVFVARGITTTQALATTDCNFSGAGNPPFYSDDVATFLRQGQSVTISMNSTDFDAALEVLNANGTLLMSNNDANGTTNAQIVFVSPADNFYIIVPTSHLSAATGAYTLIIQ
jgi:Bacterial Ig-like domain (group 1)